MSVSGLLLQAGGGLVDALDSISSNVGVELFEEEIDDVIFQTNEFLTDATFTGDNGPFWWILQMSMCLGALFAIIMAAGMAYKMMVYGMVTLASSTASPISPTASVPTPMTSMKRRRRRCRTGMPSSCPSSCSVTP